MATLKSILFGSQLDLVLAETGNVPVNVATRVCTTGIR
jgi:hypothetical protein